MSKQGLFIFMVFTLLSNHHSFCQESDITEKAAQSLRSKSYWNSIRELYLSYKNLTDDDQKAETLAQLGSAYLHTQRYEKANYFFQAALSKKENNVWQSQYIKSLIANQELKEAKKQLETYRELYGDADQTFVRLEKNIALHTQWEKGVRFYQVKPIPALNSPESDFSPLILGQTLFFTSMRNNVKGSELDLRTGYSFSDIFRSQIFLLEEERLMDATFSTPLPIANANTVQHEGALSFCIEKQKVFYSQCKKTRKNHIVCNIYQADIKEGKWKNHSALFAVDTNTVYSHPCISQDGGTLYFTSNLL